MHITAFLRRLAHPIIVVAFSSVTLVACNGFSLSGKSAAGIADSSVSTPSGASDKTAGTTEMLIDTTKLKGEMNSLLNSVATGKPDTAKMKQLGSDVLNTTASMLSDSGIDKMYGNNNDPAVRTADSILKKMRNSMGITPASLDSMRKSAAALKGQ